MPGMPHHRQTSPNHAYGTPLPRAPAMFRLSSMVSRGGPSCGAAELANGSLAHRRRPERFFLRRGGGGGAALARRSWAAAREPALSRPRPTPAGAFVVESPLVRGRRPERGGLGRYRPRRDLRRSPSRPAPLVAAGRG